MNHAKRIGFWIALISVVVLAAGGANAATRERVHTPQPTAKSADASATAAKTETPPAAADSATAASTPAKSEGEEVLKGGSDGTVFRSLTVQGDDRIHLEVERPSLDLELDPQQAPGLTIGDAADVLQRTGPDFDGPLTSLSARAPSPYVAQPWLDRFVSGAIARFRPDVENVERWRLMIADSRGTEVARMEGHGKPPRELTWDGRGLDGAPALPGRTYSYVFEAWDKAGNRRHFVGTGFSVASYAFAGPSGPVLQFSARELDRDAPPSGPGAADPPPLLIEAASRLQQAPDPTRPVQVTVMARGGDRATALSQRVAKTLGALMVGDPARIRPIAQVVPDAPEDGVVRIEFVK